MVDICIYVERFYLHVRRVLSFSGVWVIIDSVMELYYYIEVFVNSFIVYLRERFIVRYLMDFLNVSGRK